MNILITGGAGFLGQRLARSLLEKGVPAPGGDTIAVRRLILADRVATDAFTDPRVEQIIGDIADPAYVERLISPEIDVVYHLAAVVSGEAEANFDLGMRVNVDASRTLLEACRATGRCPRVIFTSSVAVFGPDDGQGSEPLVDPQSSYGAEKAIAELLLKDYARRGFVDGLVLRLPTISVRPGKPNKAASSFASGIVREPLTGVEADCPAPLDTKLWLLSPRGAIANLAHAAALRPDELTSRIINLPGLSVTVSDMLDSLERVGGADARKLVTEKPDVAVTSIVASWPSRWNDAPARKLGFVGDSDFDAVVRAFIEEELA